MDSLADQLERHGYAALHAVVDRESIERVRRAIRHGLRQQAMNLVKQGLLPPADEAAASDFDRGISVLMARGTRIAGLQVFGNKLMPKIADAMDELRSHVGLIALARTVLGQAVVATPQFALRAHAPNQVVTLFPWHQDIHFLDLDDKNGGRFLNFWIPLVAIDARVGGLEIIDRSHKFGVLRHAQEAADEGAAGYTAVSPDYLPDGPRITPEMVPGDAIVMLEKTVHRSVPNTSSVTRWSVDIRYAAKGVPLGRSGHVLEFA